MKYAIITKDNQYGILDANSSEEALKMHYSKAGKDAKVRRVLPVKGKQDPDKFALGYIDSLGDKPMGNVEQETAKNVMPYTAEAMRRGTPAELFSLNTAKDMFSMPGRAIGALIDQVEPSSPMYRNESFVQGMGRPATQLNIVKPQPYTVDQTGNNLPVVTPTTPEPGYGMGMRMLKDPQNLPLAAGAGAAMGLSGLLPGMAGTALVAGNLGVQGAASSKLLGEEGDNAAIAGILNAAPLGISKAISHLGGSYLVKGIANKFGVTMDKAAEMLAKFRASTPEATGVQAAKEATGLKAGINKNLYNVEMVNKDNPITNGMEQIEYPLDVLSDNLRLMGKYSGKVGKDLEKSYAASDAIVNHMRNLGTNPHVGEVIQSLEYYSKNFPEYKAVIDDIYKTIGNAPAGSISKQLGTDIGKLNDIPAIMQNYGLANDADRSGITRKALGSLAIAATNPWVSNPAAVQGAAYGAGLLSRNAK